MKFSTLFKPSLRRFSTSFDLSIGACIQRLAANDPALRVCYLNTSRLDANATRDLCLAIGSNKQLVTLGLEGANISDSGTAEIAKCLRLNTKLRELTLYNTGMINKSAVALANALGEAENLEKFQLNDNTLDEISASAFRTAMCWSIARNIRTVGFNNIGKPAAQIMVPVFKLRQNLSFFEYSENSLDDEAAYEIAAMIEVNPNLAYLNLKNNQFGKPGIKAIYKALQHDSVFPVILDLTGNPGVRKRVTPQ